MLKNGKRWLFMLVALVFVAGLLGVPHILAASQGYTPQEVSNVPPEWKNLPPVTELKPDPACEVKLEKVVIINHPGGVGQTVQVRGSGAVPTEPVRFKLLIDPVRRTYRTVKVPLTDKMRQELEKLRQQHLKEAASLGRQQ